MLRGTKICRRGVDFLQPIQLICLVCLGIPQQRLINFFRRRCDLLMIFEAEELDKAVGDMLQLLATEALSVSETLWKMVEF